jgi:hypothetical protein
VLRGTSFGLLEQFLGSKPLKLKRTLRLWAGFFPPRSPLYVYLENLVEGSFSGVSRASPIKTETVPCDAPPLASIYKELPPKKTPLRKKRKEQN